MRFCGKGGLGDLGGVCLRYLLVLFISQVNAGNKSRSLLLLDMLVRPHGKNGKLF